MAARILAVLAALGMIVGAFFYRYGLPGGEDGGGGTGGSGEAAGAIFCALELGAVCDAIDGAKVEPAATTAATLIATRSAASAGIRGWVAPGPWAAMVDEGRKLGSKATLFARTQPLATTALVAVARKGQFPAGCAPPTWRCIGDAAQDPGFRLGGDPLTSPTGLFSRAAALGGFFGRSNFATNDLDEQPDARPWLDNLNNRLAAAGGFGAGSLGSFVLQQGSARIYLTTAAAAKTANLDGNAQFDVIAPTAPAGITAGFTPTASSGGRIDDARVGQALRVAGWSAVGPGAKDDGLPSPGVLLALLEG